MYDYRRMTPEERKQMIEERIANGYPKHSPPHPFRFEGYYFITAANFEHRYLMKGAKRRQTFASNLLEAFTKIGCQISAWVILMNHYHLLVWVPDFDAMAIMIGRLHGSSSKKWNVEEQTVGRKCWYRYADRVIRNEDHYWATVNYIHYNPVRHRYVSDPYNWVESSLHSYFASKGREWLRDNWVNYPVLDYGKGWDVY